MSPKNKITLAYSGGLDTSYCIPYLREQGFEVHAVHVNSGSFDKDDVASLETRAGDLGATTFASLNIEEEYYSRCIRFLVYGNVLRNNNYPLSVSSERPFQSLAVLSYCRQHDIKYVAHGSTGAGNDQVRFDIIFRSLAPDIEIVTPIRDNKLSRAQEVAYLSEKGFDWSIEKAEYSVNKGLWGTSIGGVETLGSKQSLPERAYPSSLNATEPIEVNIEFENGEICAVNSKKGLPVDLIRKLESIAGAFAIGRDTHVGDTIIGIKGRVGFEAAAPTVIIKSHELLGNHTLGKWQIYWKKQLSEWYGMMLHEGKYLDPLMRDIESFLQSTQKNVSGKVSVRLRPYGFDLLGIESEKDLMNTSFGSYGEENLAWSGADARGFIEIMSNADKIYYHTNKDEQP